MRRIEVVLEHRWAYVVVASRKAEKFLRDYYSYFAPAARYDRRYKLYMYAKWKAATDGIANPVLPGWDGKIRMYKQGAVPAGLFRATIADLRRQGLRFKVRHKRPVLRKFSGSIAVYDEKYRYQHACVASMCAAMREGGGIVLAATGSGKTKIAADFFKLAPYECLFVVDTIALMHQSQKEIESWLGEKVGVVGDSEYKTCRVTVATIQTLSKHAKDKKFMRWFKSVQVMLVDELHEQMGRRNFSVLERVDPLAVFGLTATLQLKLKPVRFRAWSFCGPVIFEFPLSEATAQKVVSKGAVLQLLFPQMPVHDDEVGNYQAEYMSDVVENKSKLRACSRISRWLTRVQGRYVMVLAERVLHIDALSRAATVEHGTVRGAVKGKERLASVKAFEKGTLRLLIASRVFKKGMSIKRIDGMIDAAEGNSKNDAMQKYGRGVRLHDDKASLVYIDIGTQSGRLLSRARKRRRALVEAGIAVTTVSVDSSLEALHEVKRFVRRIVKKEQTA